MQQIQLEKTLDVEVVERHLAELWQQTAGETDDDDAVLRARVANLLVYVPRESLLKEVDEMMPVLTAIHPSRVLIMLGDKSVADRDIEMSIASFCQSDKRTGAKRLCCEEVTLKAQGSFVAELPSAALPLLVSDLPTFLWWRDALMVSGKVFGRLLRGIDRLIIDSAEFEDSHSDLLEIDRLFKDENYRNVGISDLNWARLTLWRGLLADFYDVPAYQSWLDQVDSVQVDYVAPEHEPSNVAPQALLIVGWLASRLGWSLGSNQRPGENDETLSFKISSEDRGSSPTVREGVGNREVKVELIRVERGERKPGRLVQVKLQAGGVRSAVFSVKRSDDNLHIVSEAELAAKTQRGRVLPVRNRSTAQLLSREMEILCNDQIYQEAVAIAARMIDIISGP